MGTEVACHVGTSNDDQEGDQTADHVKAVEARGDEEGGTEGRGRERHTCLYKFGVFEGLNGNEDGTHQERQDEPFRQPPLADLEDSTGTPRNRRLTVCFYLVHANLAGERRKHEDRRVNQGKREGQVLGIRCPDVWPCGLEGEICLLYTSDAADDCSIV